MKYAIAIVAFCALLVLGWAVTNGTVSDVSMVLIAVLSVIFFSTLPVILGVLYRTKVKGGQHADLRPRTVITPFAQPDQPEQSARAAQAHPASNLLAQKPGTTSS